MLFQVWLTVFEKLVVSLFAYNVHCVCIIALYVIKNELNHFGNFNSIFIALERNENTEWNVYTYLIGRYYIHDYFLSYIAIRIPNETLL